MNPDPNPNPNRNNLNKIVGYNNLIRYNVRIGCLAITKNPYFHISLT